MVLYTAILVGVMRGLCVSGKYELALLLYTAWVTGFQHIYQSRIRQGSLVSSS